MKQTQTLVDVKADGGVIVVNPGFNAARGEGNFRALEHPAEVDNFIPEFQKVLKAKKSYVLVLGEGFEQPESRLAIGNAACAGLASIEQLRLLQKSGLTTVVMASPHPTLVQNARAVGLSVVIGGQ